MQSCGKTRSMSTSQAREINNTKELTIFRLQNVSRKECWTFVYCVGTSPLISIRLMVCVRNSRLRSRYGAQGHKISLMLMIETPPFWPYSYIFWRVVYRNTRHMSTILVTNIIKRSDHAMRSSFLLYFSFLHHSCRRVFSVFYVTAIWNIIGLAARLIETLFGRQMVNENSLGAKVG